MPMRGTRSRASCFESRSPDGHGDGTLQGKAHGQEVALSGAGGIVGGILREELQQRGVDLRSAGGHEPLEPIVPGEDIMHGDIRDPAVVDRMSTASMC